MTEFGGWEMPLRYSRIVEEHLTVRRDAGLFDVSHMGKFLIQGARAREDLLRLSTNSIPATPVRARYTHLLNPEGHIIDDVIVTCLTPTDYLLVSNAGPRDKVLEWLRDHGPDSTIRDITSEYLCLALQGPKAARILQLVTSFDLEGIRPFQGAVLDLLLAERLGTPRNGPGVPVETEGWGALEEVLEIEGDGCLATRTGYTGEDGFELYPRRDLGLVLWNSLIAAGDPRGLRPAGLGARDTLRLEKGLLLSGTDFDGTQSSLETSTPWVVKWDHEFLGREALARQRDAGGFPRLMGIVLQDRGVPRRGHEVVKDGRRVGVVTSGTMSPSLNKGIALAYVAPDVAVEGTPVAVVVRGRRLGAVVEEPPFV